MHNKFVLGLFIASLSSTLVNGAPIDLGSRCSELVSVPTFLVHRDYQVEGIPLQRRSFLKHVTNTLVRPAQRIAGLGQIRGLKLVKSAKGKGTLDDVQASTNKATHDNVVKALEKLEEKNPALKSYSLRGTKFHKSHKDPQDPQDVLSVRLYSSTKGDDASHVETVHIHKDGTYKSSKK